MYFLANMIFEKLECTKKSSKNNNQSNEIEELEMSENKNAFITLK